MTDGSAGEAFAYDGNGAECVGELFRPARPNGRGMLVVHEADGIGGNVRRHSRLLAEAGFTVLAADMHGGGMALEGEAMRAALERFRGDPDLLRGRVRAGLDALAGLGGFGPGQLSAIGYCFGGFAVLELARSGAPLAAVASFHGLLTTRRPAEPGGVRARVAAYTGAKDPLVPPQDIAAFQAEMMAADVDWRLAVYGRALHSFTNVDVAKLGDPRMDYHRDAHADSWAALMRFLEGAPE